MLFLNSSIFLTASVFPRTSLMSSMSGGVMGIPKEYVPTTGSPYHVFPPTDTAEISEEALKAHRSHRASSQPTGAHHGKK